MAGILLFCFTYRTYTGAVRAIVCWFWDPPGVVFKLSPEIIYVKLNSLNLISLVKMHAFFLVLWFQTVSYVWNTRLWKVATALICPITVWWLSRYRNVDRWWWFSALIAPMCDAAAWGGRGVTRLSATQARALAGTGVLCDNLVLWNWLPRTNTGNCPEWQEKHYGCLVDSAR